MLTVSLAEEAACSVDSVQSRPLLASKCGFIPDGKWKNLRRRRVHLPLLFQKSQLNEKGGRGSVVKTARGRGGGGVCVMLYHLDNNSSDR